MGKGGGGDTSGADARAEEERRKAVAATEIANIEDVFSSFNPDYWAGQSSDLQARYNPQVDTAYGEAKTNLLSDLATKGHGRGSSVYQQGLGKLDRKGRVVRENLATSIMDAISSAEMDTLNRKQNLISTVNAASDPAGAGAGAADMAASLRTPVSTGFNVGGAFEDYKNMQSIADIIKSTSQKSGGVQMFGRSTPSGKVVN